MKQLIPQIIFAAALTLLLACSEANNTASDTERNPDDTSAMKSETKMLDLSLPEETITDQTIPMTNELPLLPELFDQEKASSKYQLVGQVLLEEKAPLGVEALDGAKVSITVKQ